MDLKAVFFDLGDTLGTAVLGGQPPKLVGFNVFPYVTAILADLTARGLKLGVISNTGGEKTAALNGILQPTGLLAQLDLSLLVYSGDEGVTKASPEIFKRAAARAGVSAAGCLFVGEDAAERTVAVSAGWAVCPHPMLVGEVLDGQSLQFVRLTIPAAHAAAPWRQELRKRAFLPQHLAGPGGTTVYGLTSQRVALELINLRFGVELLGPLNLPQTTDLYLLRDDLARQSGFLVAEGEAVRVFATTGAQELVLSATPDGVIAAVPADVERGVDAFHFDSARHGHTLKLTPDPLLWDTLPPAAGLMATAGFAPPTLPPEIAAALALIDPTAVARTVERYSGQRPLDGTESGSRVKSRHILEEGNARAVDQLVADLEAIGPGKFTVRRHPFSHAGRSLQNIEAELTGESPELVLVTAHMDSTAGSEPGFNPLTDAAPGADDDASGVAGVLAVAERLATIGKPSRTIRFVLFNAEEQGLIGSRAYARRSKSLGEVIVAVWQMDMIGFNHDAPRKWELHAGYEPSAEVEAQSRTLAGLLAGLVPQAAPDLPPPQLYHTAGPVGDPAAGRSDHASFQAHGYPACLVSEDFFIDALGGAAPDANPNYHRRADTVIDPVYAADLARVVAAATWVSANQPTVGGSPTARAISRPLEPLMRTTRILDTRTRPATFSPAITAQSAPAMIRSNALTGSPAVIPAPVPTVANSSLVERAMSFAQTQPASFGFQPGQAAEFAPDPTVQRTSAGSAAVNLKQMYRGLTVFQMTRTVRFNSAGQVVDAAGDTAPIPPGVNTEPRLTAETAVLKAAQHLAATGTGETFRDAFGQENAIPALDVAGFRPEVVSGFPLPSRPTVLDRGPFENLIPAYLLIFQQPGRSRLAWHTVFTLPGYADQYVAIVAADDPGGEILYCESTMMHATARGRVYEFSPGVANRRMIEFPRPLSEYPVMPAAPLSGFPTDWVETDKTQGNSTRATLNTGLGTLTGMINGGVIEFDPSNGTSDDQKLLNIFYFCNYMHDFLYLLGFDEASGNFQQVNFTNTGAGGDPVRARAHSGAVSGTANMATGPDGLPPLMNMGLVVATDRHTAFDADVVFHEYVHGLTNRLVGGRLDQASLAKLQSRGMGEGWSDYFALTVQNFFRSQEKVVTGDWVVANASGIRRAPYDDNYPFTYGQLAQFFGEHSRGEVWCAALMMMTRRLRAALGNDQQGYRLAWQIVVDGLKLTPANPTFLDGRDAILRALDDLLAANRVTMATHQLARRAAWQAFAHFGMGASAFSADASDLIGIVADTSIPPGV